MPDCVKDFPKVKQYLTDLERVCQLNQDYPLIFSKPLPTDKFLELKGSFNLLISQQSISDKALEKAYDHIEEAFKEIKPIILTAINHYLKSEDARFHEESEALKKICPTTYREIINGHYQALLPFHRYFALQTSYPLDGLTLLNSVGREVSGLFKDNPDEKSTLLSMIHVASESVKTRQDALKKVLDLNVIEKVKSHFDDTLNYFTKIKFFLVSLNLKDNEDINTILIRLQEGSVILDASQNLAKDAIVKGNRAEALEIFLKSIKEQRVIINTLVCYLIKEQVNKRRDTLTKLLQKNCPPSVELQLLIKGSIRTNRLIELMRESIQDEENELKRFSSNRFFSIKQDLQDEEDEFNVLKDYLSLKEHYIYFLKVFNSDEIRNWDYINNLFRDKRTLVLEDVSQALDSLDNMIKTQSSYETITCSENEDGALTEIESIKKIKVVLLKIIKKQNLLLHKIEDIFSYIETQRDIILRERFSSIKKTIDEKIQQSITAYRNTVHGEKNADNSVGSILALKGIFQESIKKIKDNFLSVNKIYLEIDETIKTSIKEAFDRLLIDFNHDMSGALSVFKNFPYYNGAEEEQELIDFLNYQEALKGIQYEVDEYIQSHSQQKESIDYIQKNKVVTEYHRRLFDVVRQNHNKPFVAKAEIFLQTLIPGDFKPPFEIDVTYAKSQLNKLRRAVKNAELSEILAIYDDTKYQAKCLIDKTSHHFSIFEKIKKLYSELSNSSELIVFFDAQLAGSEDVLSIKRVGEQLKREITIKEENLKNTIIKHHLLCENYQKLLNKINHFYPYVYHMKSNFLLQGSALDAFLKISVIRDSLKSVRQFESLILFDDDAQSEDVINNSTLQLQDIASALKVLSSLEKKEREAYENQKNELLIALFNYQSVFREVQPIGHCFYDTNWTVDKYLFVVDTYREVLEQPLKEKWFSPQKEKLAKLSSHLTMLNDRSNSEEVMVVKKAICDLKEAYVLLKKKNSKDARLMLLENCHDGLVKTLQDYFKLPADMTDELITKNKVFLLNDIQRVVKTSLYGVYKIESLSDPENNAILNFFRAYVMRPLINLLVKKGVMRQEHLALNAWGASKLETKIANDAKSLLALKRQSVFFKAAGSPQNIGRQTCQPTLIK